MINILSGDFLSYVNNEKVTECSFDIMLKDIPYIVNKDILVVDDIYDTGETLQYINEKLLEFGAKSISNVVFVKRTFL